MIESKCTKQWKDAYIEQVKAYMEREGTEFEILATQTLPDDALNNTIWRDGVLVVNVDNIEPSYVFVREYLKLKKRLEEDYSEKIMSLEV